MRRIRLLLLALPVAVLIGSTMALPVYARDGEPDSSGSSGSGSSSSDSSSDDQKAEDTPTTTAAEDDSSTEAEDSTVRHKQEQARERAKELISEAKDKQNEDQKNVTDEVRQKRCEARKTGIINRTDTLTAKAKRHLEKVDSVFAKIKAYKESANLTVANYDELVSKATAAKATATASVKALENVQITSIDCTADTISDDVATFKAAVTQARSDLKAYRSTVKDLLSAVESAKED